MKSLKSVLIVLSLTVFSHSAIADKINNPVLKDGVYVDVKNSTPYTGEVTLKSLDYTLYGQLVDGTKHGTWLTYDYKSRINNISEYSYGNLDGILLNYYPSGRLLDVDHYKDDKRNGLNIRFHENGFPKSKLRNKNGVMNGLQEIFYEEGTLESRGHYVNGTKEGYWLHKHYNGEINNELTGNYFDGQRIFP